MRLIQKFQLQYVSDEMPVSFPEVFDDTQSALAKITKPGTYAVLPVYVAAEEEEKEPAIKGVTVHTGNEHTEIDLDEFRKWKEQQGKDLATTAN